MISRTATTRIAPASLALGLLAAVCLSGKAMAAFNQTTFQIGTYWDPCLSTNTNKGNTTVVNQHKARFQLAKNAYFNLLTGTQDAGFVVQTQAGMDYALYIASQVGLKYLATDNRYYSNTNGVIPFNATVAANVISHYKNNLPAPERTALYGYNLKDEPATVDAVELKKWTSYLKANDNTRLAFLNLLPAYGFTSRAEYESYLDLFLKDAASANNPDVVSFDHYPFHSDGTIRPDYFYNLDVVRRKAGSKPFWAHPMSADHLTYVNPTAAHLRFMTFAPVAYGAKGLIYFTFENPNVTGYRGSIVNNCDDVTSKYADAKTINHYLTRIVGPMVMSSTNLGAFHKSSAPANEVLSNSQMLNRYNAPIVSDITNGAGMVGVFRNKSTTSTYHLLLMHKGLTSVSNVTVTLKGDYRSKVTLSPSVVGYAGSTTYSPVTISYDANANKSTFSLAFSGGEGRVVRITGVGNTFRGHARTDFNGDGRADLSAKADNGQWNIDYSPTFSGWEFISPVGSYGDPSAHPVPADYDGDGKTDLSVKVDDGRWLIDYARNGFGVWDWKSAPGVYGGADYHPVPADYDGDGKADLSAKTDGQVWHIDYSVGGFFGWNWSSAPAYGGTDAHPVPADYDGDGKADLAVKVDDGRWLIDYAAGGFGGWNWGSATGIYGDATNIPVPMDYDADGLADLAVKNSAGRWRIDYASTNGFGAFNWSSGTGIYGDVTARPAPADYDGDDKADLSCKLDDGRWRIDYASGGYGSYNWTSAAIYGNSTWHGLFKTAANTGILAGRRPVSAVFDLPVASDVDISVYAPDGGKIATLFQGRLGEGNHELSWSREDAMGPRPHTGIHLLRISSPVYSSTRRVFLSE